jgi:carboxyl-terminal processing protease
VKTAKITIVGILLSITMSVPALNSGATPQTPSPLSLNDRISVFEKVWRIIDRDFYDAAFNGADWRTALTRYRPRVEAARDDSEFYDLLDEMLAELRDSHTSFRRPDAYAGKVEKSSNVGVTVFPIEGRLTVTNVERDTEAARAGVKVGMLLKTFDGKPIEERLTSLGELIPQRVGISSERMLMVLTSSLVFNGDNSTSVSVGFETDAGKLLEVSLPRRQTRDEPSMMARRLPSGIGYLRFKPWVPPNDKRFPEELRKLLDTRGLIIDLRGNRGGSFMTADYFLPPGTLLGTSTWRNGKVEKSHSRKLEPVYAGRLAVLVDEESGSASENFAAVIQESSRGIVIGRQTCGCFTSSYFESVKGGGRLQWSRVLPRTIKGRKVEGVGVIPDRTVQLTLAALREGRDPVLEEAERVLGTQ